MCGKPFPEWQDMFGPGAHPQAKEVFGPTLPYKRLILTDLEEHKYLFPEHSKLQQLTRSNTKTLCDSGAAGPFSGISGFAVGPESQFKSFDEFAKKMGKELGLVCWGSPHWGETADQNTRGFKDSAQFKTNAWESMAWLAGSACVLMTFHECYKVEFWGPTYTKPKETDTRAVRELRVMPGYFRQYSPLMSGPVYNRVCDLADKRVMVALLIPKECQDLVTKHSDGRCDVGMTMLKIYQQMEHSGKCAMELGGQSYCLSMEIHLAYEELLEEQKNKRFKPNVENTATASGASASSAPSNCP